MIIIAFSDKTSKILPRIFCSDLKHCAPIMVNNNTMTMYQFISRNNIAKIKLNMRDIRILQRHGWKFIYLPVNTPYEIHSYRAWTCVQFCKHVIGLHNICVQTPRGLYNAIK